MRIFKRILLDFEKISRCFVKKKLPHFFSLIISMFLTTFFNQSRNCNQNNLQENNHAFLIIFSILSCLKNLFFKTHVGLLKERDIFWSSYWIKMFLEQQVLFITWNVYHLPLKKLRSRSWRSISDAYEESSPEVWINQ